jgi:hypothetical protein
MNTILMLATAAILSYAYYYMVVTLAVFITKGK